MRKRGWIGRVRGPRPADPPGRTRDLDVRDLRELFDADLSYPDVYRLAAHLGQRFGCTSVIDVGCAEPRRLFGLAKRFGTIGLGPSAAMSGLRDTAVSGTWIDWDATSPTDPAEVRAVLPRSVVVCAGVLDAVTDPRPVLDLLRSWSDRAPVVLVATAGRDLPATLASSGSVVAFAGDTVHNDTDTDKAAKVAVVDRRNAKDTIVPARAGFRVLGIVATYNEEDVIEATVRRLVGQGIEPHVMDNWSTDSTYERVRELERQGLATVERFPATGPTADGDLRAILRRKVEVGRASGADWVIHHDVDEVRRPPWPGVSMRDAFHHVDRQGFNVIDHFVVEFHPTDDSFTAERDVETHFRHFSFARRPGKLHLKAWKNQPGEVRLGPHRVTFPGVRVYPYKFLLKHYTVRSQSHGERKIFDERQARWEQEMQELGWHNHYYMYPPGHSFIRDPADLEVFEEADFNERYVVERLSGAGLVR